jgi:hypothetical protein
MTEYKINSITAQNLIPKMNKKFNDNFFLHCLK